MSGVLAIAAVGAALYLFSKNKKDVSTVGFKDLNEPAEEIKQTPHTNSFEIKQSELTNLPEAKPEHVWKSTNLRFPNQPSLGGTFNPGDQQKVVRDVMGQYTLDYDQPYPGKKIFDNIVGKQQQENPTFRDQADYKTFVKNGAQLACWMYHPSDFTKCIPKNK